MILKKKISEGTLAHYFNLNRFKTKLYGGQTKIIPLSIEQFIKFVTVGIKNKFNNPSLLRDWLEQQWKNNQSMEDEEIWSASIDKSISRWTDRKN